MRPGSLQIDRKPLQWIIDRSVEIREPILTGVVSVQINNELGHCFTIGVKSRRLCVNTRRVVSGKNVS